MRKVAFRDVICRVKEIVDKDDTELEYYVGGEHFDCGEVQITKRGILQGSTIGPAFHMRFRPGDVLLMSRNPHLRKAGVVNFDGICSDVSYVCRTRDESILPQRLIPFIFQTEAFWSYATAHRHGSTNYFLNWKDFEGYEFKLPEGDQLHYITDLLWAYERLRRHYLSLIVATDDLVKSQFVEMFGDYRPGIITWPEYSLQKLIDMGWITYHLDGNHGGEYPRADEFVDSGVPYISANCISDGIICFQNAKYVTVERSKRFRKGIARNNDVLFAHNATVGPVAILRTDAPIVILGTSLTAFRCNEEHFTPEYLKAYLENSYFVRQYEGEMQQSTRKQVPITTQRKYTIVVPSQRVQKEFSAFVHQADKSKLAIRQALESLEKSRTAIMNRIFG